MYVRFETLKQNHCSASRLGIFQEAGRLRDSEELTESDHDYLSEHLSWFNEHLTIPACLKEPGYHRAICWFHPRAQKPIFRIREVCALLEEYGIFIEQVESRFPGKIVYEDGWQIVAIPFRKKSRMDYRFYRKLSR